MTDFAAASSSEVFAAPRAAPPKARGVPRLRIVEGGAAGAPAVPPRAGRFVLEVPMAIEEMLVARLLEQRALVPSPRAERRRVRFAGWELDLVERRLIAPGGGVTRVPGLEFALLHALVRHPRRVLSRGELALLTRRDGDEYVSPRTIDSYVARLRRRLARGGGGALIATARGVGYSLDADVVRV